MRSNHPDLKAICDFLSAERIRQGLTQRQLADRMGNHQSAVSQLERGEYGSIHTYEQWAKALGYGMQYRLYPIGDQ